MEKLGCKPSSVLIEKNHKIIFEKKVVDVDKGQYQILAKKLVYLARVRLYLEYAISVISQLIHDTRKINLQFVDHVLEYSKATQGR